MRRSIRCDRRIAPAAVVTLAVLATAVPAVAGVSDRFPSEQPNSRGDVVRAMTADGDPAIRSLTARLLRHETHDGLLSPELRRALGLLGQSYPLAGAETVTGPAGVPIRFVLDPEQRSRIPADDRDANGVPDGVDAVLGAIAEAASLLHDQLELPPPSSLEEIRLLDLEPEVDGYVVPGLSRLRGPRILLDGTPEGGPDALRGATIHEYTHAVLAESRPGIPIEWREALATWVRLRLDADDPLALGVVDRYLQRLADGLSAPGRDDGAGQAAWFAYLDQAHGLSAVRLAIEELDRGVEATDALDRALRRSGGTGLSDAFRDFQLWALLVGQRSDRQHFSFADRLGDPAFASTVDGLPSLSVHDEPALAPWGAARVLFRTGDESGGLRIRFEGDYAGSWQTDLLLTGRDGSLRRVPFRLDEGRGELTVPLDGVREAVLLVRNLESDGDEPRAYTWVANLDRRYPFELSALEARRNRRPGGGALIAWETSTEQDLIGFNVQRRGEDAETFETINPIWVPALGLQGEVTAYRYVDPTAEPGRAYVYRVEGVTRTGMTGLSTTVVLPPAAAR